MPKKSRYNGRAKPAPMGGETNFPQLKGNPQSPQKGMIDDDMGKYGGVAPEKVPKVVDKQYANVPGGGSPGSFQTAKSKDKV